MATINYETFDAFINNRARYITWTALGELDDGEPLEFAGHADKTLQVFGAFDGATVYFECSNDPRVLTDPNNAEWFGAKDGQDIDLSFTAGGGQLILENPRFLRPRVAGGGSSTDVVVILCCKSPLR